MRIDGKVDGDGSLKNSQPSGGARKVRDLERQLAGTIRVEMWALRRRLRSDPTAHPLVWCIQDRLACSQRPLRDHPAFLDQKPLPPEAGPHVIAGVKRVRETGIRSVICLMHRKELRYYDGLVGMEDGLFSLYRQAGLQIRHLEWADPAHGTSEEREALKAQVMVIKAKALDAFGRLPRAVLVHCSAAIDRSTPVVAHIAANAGPEQ